MLRCKPAEESFKKALLAFQNRKPKEALALFEAAVTLDSRSQTDGPVDPRYRSYYGLCLAMQGGKVREGLTLCRKAAEQEFYNHSIWMNLGRVELEAGNRAEAHAAFRRGFHLAPAAERKAFRRMLEIAGMRRKPFFSFLPRSHPLNRFIGRLTWRKRREGK
ncbi:MAG: tetratricopeptide repeat protein [Acidobacteriota bacterium]|jgi:tetratricopeptide (TPR) repeat protein